MLNGNKFSFVTHASYLGRERLLGWKNLTKRQEKCDVPRKASPSSCVSDGKITHEGRNWQLPPTTFQVGLEQGWNGP